MQNKRIIRMRENSMMLQHSYTSFKLSKSKKAMSLAWNQLVMMVLAVIVLIILVFIAFQAGRGGNEFFAIFKGVMF
jgi:hypothetical protein